MNRSAFKVATMVLLLAALAAGPGHGQDDAYQILLTNDDGIESAGIQVLADKLRAVGQVHVVAPCGQQSGASMSVALRDSLTLRTVERDGKLLGRCVDTTPAGSVILAVTTLAPEGGFDLVVSGINRGANVGAASHMSGTVGAAMMGAFYGVPAIAVSLGARDEDYAYAAGFVVATIEKLKQEPEMGGVVLSINIPRSTEEQITGVSIARMGGIHLSFDYDELESAGPERSFRPRIGLTTSGPAESDTEAFLADRISITPLQFDWTAYPMIDRLRAWGLSHKPAAKEVARASGEVEAMSRDQAIDYVELPGDDFDALEAFYSATFGWSFTDYGPEYRSFSDGSLSGGFYKSTLQSKRDAGAALIVVYADDLEATRDAVIANKGKIHTEIFSFPGGRRFHFEDPHGNELAVWSSD